MKDTKDNFSQQSEGYAIYRPGYPQELFDWLFSQCKGLDTAWDCATGNGQAAVNIAAKFQLVHATDISISQLGKSELHENIQYKLERAEHTAFADNSFDLITVAQSLHWFDHIAYFKEVQRVAKDEAVFAAWGYNLPRVNEQVDQIVDDFYSNVIGDYWDAERRHVDEQYASIEVPFEPIPSPLFKSSYHWTVEQFLGYINTWSAVQHYMRDKGSNPVEKLKHVLTEIWDINDTYEVSFPIFMLAHRIKK